MFLYGLPFKTSSLFISWKVCGEPYQIFLKFLELLFLRYKLPPSLEVLGVLRVVSQKSCNTWNDLPSHEIASCHKNESHH